MINLIKAIFALFILHNVTALYIRIIMIISPLIVMIALKFCLKLLN